MVRSPLQISLPRKKLKNGENSHKACMSTLSCGRSPLINRHLVCEFFIKILIIIFIYINIYRPYVCDPLGSYISVVNNSIVSIIPYLLTFINYIY